MDPSDLREALDALPGHDFKLGEMNDPSEVLSAIYECLDKPKQLKRRDGRCVRPLPPPLAIGQIVESYEFSFIGEKGLQGGQRGATEPVCAVLPPRPTPLVPPPRPPLG